MYESIAGVLVRSALESVMFPGSIATAEIFRKDSSLKKQKC